MTPSLVLFDIDGTLLRKSGSHHRVALEDAVRLVAGVQVSTVGVPLAGMLDRDILRLMMLAQGLRPREISPLMPAILEKAQLLYGRRCPDLRRRVCPGVRRLLPRLIKAGVITGLVTGNLSRIGWKKMDRSGLRPFFRFGAFAEMGRTRTHLAKLARQRAVAEGWVGRNVRAFLIGDHPHDIEAARGSGLLSIAVATGVVSRRELARHKPDFLIDDLRAFNGKWLQG